MQLSDTAVRKIKPTDKPQRVFDAGGLYLEVSPAGGKWWRLKYRFAGKEKRLSLGTYPDTGLADARAKRDEARKLLARGVDPGVERKATKIARKEGAANSFEVIAREWLAVKAPEWTAPPSNEGLTARGARRQPCRRRQGSQSGMAMICPAPGSKAREPVGDLNG